MFEEVDGLLDIVIGIILFGAFLAISVQNIGKIQNYDYRLNTLHDKTDSRQYMVFSNEDSTYYPITKEQIATMPIVNSADAEFTIYLDDIQFKDNSSAKADYKINVWPIEREGENILNPLDVLDRIPPLSVVHKVQNGAFSAPIPDSYYGFNLIHDKKENQLYTNIRFINK